MTMNDYKSTCKFGRVPRKLVRDAIIGNGDRTYPFNVLEHEAAYRECSRVNPVDYSQVPKVVIQNLTYRVIIIDEE